MKRLYMILICILLAACSNNKATINEGGTAPTFPKSAEEERLDRMGSLFGGNGIVLFGGKDGGIFSQKKSAGVNMDLWRAAIDTVHFARIVNMDYASGAIVTDWYQLENMKNIRMKISIFVLSNELTPTSIAVTVFKEELVNGKWVNAKETAMVQRELESIIFDKAVALRGKL